MNIFYNLHDFIRVKVNQEKLNLADGYNYYLRYFKISEELSDIDYEVKEFSEFSLPEDHNNVGGALGFKNGVCFVKEKYAVVLTDDQITEYTTYPNRATNLWLQLLLLRQGKSFIHGAGVEINGQGIVFPAYGGTGKTILISELRKLQNCKFFGDDYVIVDQNSQMYAYPSDFSIYPYHLTTFSELKSSEFSRFLFKRKIFNLYYLCKKVINFIWRRLSSTGTPLLSGWNADYVKVPAVKLIGKHNIGQKTRLTTAVFLSRYNGNEIREEEMSLDQLTKLTDGILWQESQHALSYLMSLASCGLVSISDITNTQYKILKNCFAPLKLFRIFIPKGLSAEAYVQYMTKFIQEILR